MDRIALPKMNKRVGETAHVVRPFNSPYFYYESSCSESGSSDTELCSEVGYGSGHSENSIFSSDEEALLRYNFFRKRSFTKRVKRKNRKRRDIDSDSASEITYSDKAICSELIKSQQSSSILNNQRYSGCERHLPHGVETAVCREQTSRAPVRSDLQNLSPTGKEVTGVINDKQSAGDRCSWHHLNGFDFRTTSSRDSQLSASHKRKSWTDSGVSLSKTDSTGSSWASRTRRSDSKASCQSWLQFTDKDMVHVSCNAIENNPSPQDSPQRGAMYLTRGIAETCGNDATISLCIGYPESLGSNSIEGNTTKECMDACKYKGNGSLNSGNVKRNTSRRLSTYDLIDCGLTNLFDNSVESDEFADSGISRQESRNSYSSAEKVQGVKSGSSSLVESISNSPACFNYDELFVNEGHLVEKCAVHKTNSSAATNSTKFDLPVLSAADEFITLVNSKRFSGQRISFDDTQYTPKEKEILEQLFKNAEKTKTADTMSDAKLDYEKKAQVDGLRLPDHLNYPLCMYYKAEPGKDTKNKGIMKSLKKLKETIKLRKTPKPAPAERLAADQPRDNDKVLSDAFSLGQKKTGAGSKGRRLIQRMLSRSSSKSAKYAKSQHDSFYPKENVFSGFRRSRSGSTRSIPDSLRSMWGRARSRSVDNIRSAFDRNITRMSARLTRTNSTHSLFGRKRSGSTDQLSSHYQETKSVFAGRRSESMRSLSAVGGFDIAVRLLSANNHRHCKGDHGTSEGEANSDLSGFFPQCAGENPRNTRRQSLVSRDNVPNFYGLQGHFIRGACQDDCCNDDACYRYSCYCDECDHCDDCSLCDEGNNCDGEDEFVYPEFAVNGQKFSHGCLPHVNRDMCILDKDMVVAPLNVTVMQERVAERRILTNSNRERLDTYV